MKTLLLVAFISFLMHLSAQESDQGFPQTVFGGKYIIKKNDLGFVGIEDQNGNEKIPFIYQHIHEIDEGLVVVKQNKASGFERTYSSGFYNKQFEPILSCNYRSISSNGDGKLIASRNADGKYGVVDTNGYVYLEFVYDELRPITEGLHVCKRDNRYGFIHPNGKTAVPFEFLYVDSFSEGLAIATKNKLFGYIDKKGRWIISEQYEIAEPFQFGYAIVGDQDGLGIINHENNVVLPAIYQDVQIVSPDRFIVGFHKEFANKLPEMLQIKDKKDLEKWKESNVPNTDIQSPDELDFFGNEGNHLVFALISSTNQSLGNQLFSSIAVVFHQNDRPLYAVQEFNTKQTESAWNFALLNDEGKLITSYDYFEILVENNHVIGLKSNNGIDQRIVINIPPLLELKKENN